MGHDSAAQELERKGVAEAEVINAAISNTLGLRLRVTGPLESADMTNIRVIKKMHENIIGKTDMPAYELYRKLIEEGSFGTESLQGFYTWTAESRAAKEWERNVYIAERLRDGIGILAPHEDVYSLGLPSPVYAGQGLMVLAQ